MCIQYSFHSIQKKNWNKNDEKSWCKCQNIFMPDFRHLYNPPPSFFPIYPHSFFPIYKQSLLLKNHFMFFFSKFTTYFGGLQIVTFCLKNHLFTSSFAATSPFQFYSPLFASAQPPTPPTNSTKDCLDASLRTNAGRCRTILTQVRSLSLSQRLERHFIARVNIMLKFLKVWIYF